MSVIGSSMAYEFRSPRISTSVSPVSVGSVASHASLSDGGIGTRTTLQLPCPSPASGASQALPLLLKWLTTAVKRAPFEFCWKVCASAGRDAGSAIAAVDKGYRIERRCDAYRSDQGGFVKQADLDGIRAKRIDLPGVGIHIDEGIGARRSSRVELIHQMLNGAVEP